jgi:hypothetical protein
MLAEGTLGVLAGAEAHSIGAIAWAVGLLGRGRASVIVATRASS